MRMMIKWTVPADQGNKAIDSGALEKSVQSMMDDLKPEAAYFMAWDGRRAGMMFFDMKDPSQIPLIAEPLFHTLNAEVEFVPVMNAEDLQKAFSRLPS
jgi:hypothetical protein